MTVCRSPTCSRGVVISFNFLFWVTGFSLILLGFWVMLDTSKAHLLHLLTAEDEARYLRVALSYTLFLLGCCMMVLVFLGCCALQSKPSLIVAYLFMLVFLECVELVAILKSLSVRGTMLVGMQSRISINLATNYGHKNNDNVNTHGDNVFTQSLDYTQYTFHCCGVTGPHEYNLTRWYNESVLSKEPRNVPVTCCSRTDQEDTGVGSPISVVSRVFHGTVEEVWQNPYVQQESDCQKNKDGARYNQGCLPHIRKWFLSQSMLIVFILLVPMALQLVSIVFFFILLRSLQKFQAPVVSRHSSAGG